MTITLHPELDAIKLDSIDVFPFGQPFFFVPLLQPSSILVDLVEVGNQCRGL